MKSLKGKITVVAGGTRGAGRGISVKLGEAGATVYVTGRTTLHSPSPMGRKETIEETAELVTRAGGVGIPVKTDHTIESDVIELFERVKAESGRLDILINDVWGGEPLTEWGKAMGEHSLAKGLQMQKQAVESHIITAHHSIPLFKQSGGGLIVEITDGVDYKPRGNFYYSLAKISNIHIAQAMAEDLKDDRITAIAVTPGFLRSEAMLELFGVTEENWKEGANKDPHFIASESPYYIGEAIRSLATDPEIHSRTGGVFSTWDLSEEYGFKDIDGTQPHWGNYFKRHVEG
ncbi:SDR family oxidoreductase [Rossellomorea aquimaris]|uniref:SDR family NAD(P)-dependent oxidoreductase n=1 Tax=Rossellomorea aquimaris TaxID=189382 RepID=A0A5D4U4T6_9BACI|nr:SDR family oxidoreductase [Rossellomorea aquimaris]TYS82364.1 SDR family NAD(P)-dependent oxidoreductase [Rossellomorea aquimaris]